MLSNECVRGQKAQAGEHDVASLQLFQRYIWMHLVCVCSLPHLHAFDRVLSEFLGNNELCVAFAIWAFLFLKVVIIA